MMCGVAVAIGYGLWILSEQSDGCRKNMSGHVTEQ